MSLDLIFKLSKTKKYKNKNQLVNAIYRECKNTPKRFIEDFLNENKYALRGII